MFLPHLLCKQGQDFECHLDDLLGQDVHEVRAQQLNTLEGELQDSGILQGSRAMDTGGMWMG
jgi:hypothetical protein